MPIGCRFSFCSTLFSHAKTRILWDSLSSASCVNAIVFCDGRQSNIGFACCDWALLNRSEAISTCKKSGSRKSLKSSRRSTMRVPARKTGTFVELKEPTRCRHPKWISKFYWKLKKLLSAECPSRVSSATAPTGAWTLMDLPCVAEVPALKEKELFRPYKANLKASDVTGEARSDATLRNFNERKVVLSCPSEEYRLTPPLSAFSTLLRSVSLVAGCTFTVEICRRWSSAGFALGLCASGSTGTGATRTRPRLTSACWPSRPTSARTRSTCGSPTRADASRRSEWRPGLVVCTKTSTPSPLPTLQVRETTTQGQTCFWNLNFFRLKRESRSWIKSWPDWRKKQFWSTVQERSI